MGIKSKIKTWFFLDDEYVEEYEEEQPVRNNTDYLPKKQPDKQKKNIVSISSVQSSKSSKVIILEPKLFSESPDIAEQIKSKKAVVVNLQNTDRIEARRIIDFLGGAVYALNGDIQRIGSDIFLCTPDNVEVTGSISEGFMNKEIDESRW